MGDYGIKGTAFESVVTDVRRLVEAGGISRDALEVRLTKDDLVLLEEKLLATSWYPIETYRRLSELLMEMEGDGRPEYIVRRGARAAERLFPIYQQLRRGEEMGSQIRESGKRWTRSDGALMASLAGAIFNFSKWRFTADENQLINRIEVTEAEPLPEVARWAAQGFIEYTASRVTGSPMQVTSERVGAGRVVFTLRYQR